MKKQLFLALALIASACVSVPRDAGTSDVRQAVAERTNLDSQETGELTADKAVAVAMANNPRLQATLAELGIARADLMQASIVRNPLFEAELRFPRDPVRPFELRLAQTLVDLIQLRRRRAAGRAAFDTAKLRVTSEVIRFAAGVREQHTELIAASQRVAQSRMNLAAAQAAVELAQRQHDAQNITDLDLENQQTQYEQAKVDLAREEQRLLVAREALLRSMALRDPAIDEHLPSDFPSLPASELDQQQLEQLAAARRLDIDIARREADLAKQRISLARLAALGDVTADVHYQRDASGAKTVGPGLEVPIPIFNNGEAARSRAEAEYLRASETLKALLAESSSQLRTARSVVAEARARVEYYRDVIVPRRRRIVELTKLEHNAMVAGIFQLLQATQSEAQARRDFIDAQRDYWIARNNLDRVLNGIAAEGGR